MKVKLWGTRGSLATPGPDTARYGGNTSCVEVRGDAGTILVLDAGTGIHRLGASIPPDLKRIDILLTHLHMDHIQGLGFFGPLYNPNMAVHIWGPASSTQSLHARLKRYLSPPLFPVRLKELASKLSFHEVPCGQVDIGEFKVSSALVCHPGPTVGYRIESAEGRVLTYIPDHEPALGVMRFPTLPREWTSGAKLAHNADVLIHDSQYTSAEYACHCGWGHSSLNQTFAFSALTEARCLVPFHHDPSHSDADLDRIMIETMETEKPAFQVMPGIEGSTIKL